MKKHEIDHWVRRQNRMHNQASIPAVNWPLIVSVVAVVGALLLILSKA